MGHLDRIAGTLGSMLLAMLLAAAPAHAGRSVALRPETGLFGGKVYTGAASLQLTAALLQAGGGAEKFSTQEALVNLLGQAGAEQELERLRQHYGVAAVANWLKVSDWLMLEGVVQLRNTATELPPPPDDLSGDKLAAALVQAGVAPGDTAFWSGYWYDQLFSHGINKVLEEGLDRRFGERRARGVYAVNNQVMYDISQSVHTQDVRLATLH